MAIDRLPSGSFRARFEAALEQRLLAAIGQLPLLELLERDRNELYRQVMGTRGYGYGDDGATRECLHLILEEAVEDLRTGTRDIGTARGRGRSRR